MNNENLNNLTNRANILEKNITLNLLLMSKSSVVALTEYKAAHIKSINNFVTI